MKNKIAAFFLLLSFSAGAQITNINVGSALNAGDGDPARVAFQKVNANFQSVSASLANQSFVAYINMSNTFTYQGVTYGPYPDQTTTISNAFNTLPLGNNPYAPGGDAIYIMPGIHMVGAFPLNWPPAGYTNSPNTLTIYGPGKTACVLYNTNLIPTDTLHIAATGIGTNQNATIFNMHDVCLATWTNAVGTNILVLGNPSVNNGLASACIQHCLFTCWSLATNFNASSGWPIFTSDIGNKVNPYPGLTAILLRNSLGDKVQIDHNSFQYVAGLYLVNDHVDFTGNTLEACGDPNMPSGLPLSPLVDNTVVYWGDGGGHNQWYIGWNEYVGRGGYTFGPNCGNHDILYDDYEEGTPWYSTNGAPFVVINGSGGTWPKITEIGAKYDNAAQFAFNTTFYDVVGNNYNNLQSDTGTNNIANAGSNFVQEASFTDGLNKFRANMTNPANVFSGAFANQFWSVQFDGNGGTNLIISNLVTHTDALLIYTNNLTVFANGNFIDPAGNYHGGQGFFTTAGQFADNQGDLFLNFSGALIFNVASRAHIFTFQCGPATIVTNSGIGGGGSATIGGTDISGLITIATGPAPVASATLATITDHTGDGTNSTVVLSPANAAASTNAIPYTTGGISSWTMNIGATPLKPSMTFQYYYTQVFGN